ncbi:endophilin-A1 [Capsaspora owczarzaki ATCC 30864]|uniref:Endophilin-A1 n=1 Tax=Capsaspora owczarzaki (strain ATCC 30864) TaxID=595528 RepID=A0A0D2WID0_CAPO3|nr:endophilin-A1 [Capsaspora owczarzaki ATCC 30864]KJE88733.1 endophilin-A1 [Capsaspora owczarzaki ATCC 30864]|eukprot:XP_004365197.1 endophilin-A1 [Capsaspora owczarzaki ATCC 30864]
MAKFFNKVNQAISERVLSAEKTELEEEFKSYEKKTDATEEAITSAINKAEQYLQPNPTARAKFNVTQKFNKATSKYPQPEGELGDSMIKGGRAIGEDANFGQALVIVGEAEKQIAEARDALDAEVQSNFLIPLKEFLKKEIKDVNFHRKKLESRRLDFDYKRRRGHKGGQPDPKADEELRIAEQKFEESKELSWNGMQAILENEAEQVSQLNAFVQAQLAFHNTAVDVLTQLAQSLSDVVQSAASRPKSEPRYARTAPAEDTYGSSSYGGSSSYAAPASSASSGSKAYRALFDFEAENPGELTFREGDTIYVSGRLDENWLEGSCNGQSGIFPVQYIEYN